MRSVVLISLALAASPALAQESDKDYLTAFLEESLSDAGRDVTITGFEGALSSQATIETLTIADDLGVWLTLEGVVLDWSRSSLLSGELVVNELSARHLVVSRLPETEDTALPAAEASGFSLPDLPVSVDIGRIAIDGIDLDAAVLGQAVQGQLEASLSLAGGAGRANVDLTRTGEGPSAAIALLASYDNATRNLDLDLAAGEAAGGLVAVALDLPGAPATDFRLAGSGPIEAFAGNVRLATDGQERLAGTVTLSGEGQGGHRLKADLFGNLAPLFLPDYADFLGTTLVLSLDGSRAASGSLTLDHLTLQAQSLQLEGRAVIASDGLPEEIALTGTLASPDGGPVLLPFGDQQTRIDRAEFSIDTVRNDTVDWTLSAKVSGLDRADMAVDDLTLAGSGRIARTPAGNSVGGTLRLGALGLLPADPALAKAMGPALNGGLKFHVLEGSDALRLSDLHLSGDGIEGTGQLRIEGLSSAFLTSGRLDLAASDLSRFDALAGVPLAGQGTIRLEGSASWLSGHLDGQAGISATDLSFGQVQIDRLLTGQTTASLSILRDETGTTLRSLTLDADKLTADLSGKIATAGSDLAGRAAISDLSALDPSYSGAVSMDLSLTGTTQAATANVTGTSTDLALGNPWADPVLAGTSSATATLGLTGGTFRIDSVQLANDQLDLSVTGASRDGKPELSIKGRLADLGLVIPDLSGPLSVTGTLLDEGASWGVDLAGRGPGKVDARLSGSLARDFGSGDLAISGTGQAALANPFIAPRVVEGPTRFDLRLSGPLGLSSLSGRLTLSGGRLSDPSLGFALERIEALADLKAGKASVSATAALSTGGNLRADGPVGLAAPYPAELSLALDRVRFFDPKLYETVLSGALAIKGPLAGGAGISGALALSETELRVPESGIDASGILLEMTHRNEPADVRATRVRAGLLGGRGGNGKTGGAAYRLDLTLTSPSRIFLRGRGIDAELGGELRLGGTTDSVIPSGEFGLIRGRLDILGKRLVLETANLMLEGSFVPHLEISASNESEGITSRVMIEGAADNPAVTFSSVPDLPQEEVLARLLFGRGLDKISALQAAQLAQAVAALAGRGGEGVIGKLRKGFGLDDLDLATADDGTTALKAGKYITENVYTEIEIDQTGTSEINLNLDLRPGVTVKGKVGADGETGIGIFVEKDY